MKKVAVFSTLLITGLIGAQVVSAVLGSVHEAFTEIITFLTMTGLVFIMIHVGYEFELNKTKVRQYGWDYGVAMTTAGFPWLFATLYFIFVIMPTASLSNWTTWKEALLIGRFAAPTATGGLFAMLVAAGLVQSGCFEKLEFWSYLMI